MNNKQTTAQLAEEHELIALKIATKLEPLKPEKFIQLCFLIEEELSTQQTECEQKVAEAVKAERERLSVFLRSEFLHYLSDPECFHGMFFDKCTHRQCETRAEQAVVSKLFELLTNTEGEA